jgi:hypothetical protein
MQYRRKRRYAGTSVCGRVAGLHSDADISNPAAATFTSCKAGSLKEVLINFTLSTAFFSNAKACVADVRIESSVV